MTCGLVLGLAVVTMAGLARTAGAVAPRPVLSTTPGVGNFIIPEDITVVGHDPAGTADPRGEFLIGIRDLANNPMPNSVVAIDFSSCDELRLCADPHDPGALVNCATRTVMKVTDVNGEVRFRVVGCSVASPGGPGAGWGCARVYADGVLGGSVSVSILDLAGCNGVDAIDLAAWAADFFTGQPVARSDFDGDHELTALDLASWSSAFFGAASLANCGAAGRCLP